MNQPTQDAAGNTKSLPAPISSGKFLRYYIAINMWPPPQQMEIIAARLSARLAIFASQARRQDLRQEPLRLTFALEYAIPNIHNGHSPQRLQS